MIENSEVFIDSTGQFVVTPDGFGYHLRGFLGYIRSGGQWVTADKAIQMGLKFTKESTAYWRAFSRLSDDDIESLDDAGVYRILQLKRAMEESIKSPTEKAIANIALAPGLHQETLELLRLAQEAQRTGKMPDLSELSKAHQ